MRGSVRWEMARRLGNRESTAQTQRSRLSNCCAKRCVASQVIYSMVGYGCEDRRQGRLSCGAASGEKRRCPRSRASKVSVDHRAIPSNGAPGPMFCNERPAMRISRHFPEKTSKPESQAISAAVPVTCAAIRDADPTPENGKVRSIIPPRRVANRERRSREHLTPKEVDKIIKAASRLGRYGHRDATLILLAYRHGLRVSELVAMRWDQIDLEQGLLHVTRLKNGVAATHPLRGPEIRALRRLRRGYALSPYVFTTERRAAMTDSA